jgi:hypothetical protein
LNNSNKSWTNADDEQEAKEAIQDGIEKAEQEQKVV